MMEQLQAVQQTSTSKRLSERNCVDLILKLRSLGLLDVVHTANAREYLTTDRVERELLEELSGAGGRCLLTDAQPLINVDMTYIEAAASAIVARGAAEPLAGGELVTSEYFDRVADEVDLLVADAGRVTLGAVATRFNLSIDTVKSRVATPARLVGDDDDGVRFRPRGRVPGKPRSPSLPHPSSVHTQACGAGTIRAVLSRGALVTAAHVRRNRARIRGALSGAAQPAGLKALSDRSGAGEDAAADDTAREAIAAGLLQGAVVGAEFVPARHAASQRR